MNRTLSKNYLSVLQTLCLEIDYFCLSKLNEMIKKQFLKSKPVCKVTFTLTPEAAENAEQVELVGDFSNWTDSPISMKKLKNGAFKTTLDL
jgi:1,4-alpha-glucan branching enzyme